MSTKDKKAVAVKYDSDKDSAPRVTAKGRGEIAKKIIEVARENRIPLYEDRDLAQVLEALDINMEIPQKLYKAIAEVLVFIYKMNQSKK